MSARARLTAILAVVGALVVVATVLAIALRPAATGAAAPTAFEVSAGMDDCGRGWGGDGHAGKVAGGEQTLTVTNTTVAGIEVYLQEVDSKRVYLDLENLGAGAHATVRVALAAGRYRVVCLPADMDPVRGPTVTVGAAPPGSPLTPGIVPVTRNDLIPVTKIYSDWVGSRIPVLRAQTAALAADAEEGDLPAARRDWLTAHSTYQTLGGAYDAFGEVGEQLDGLPHGDPTGFHLVEAQLWQGAPASAVAASAQSLVALVDRLQTQFAGAQLDPGEVALRAHEIVEDAIQRTLTGADDAGSHTSLATADAELSGAEAALAPLHDILASRYDRLAETQQALADAHRVVEAHPHAAAARGVVPRAGCDRGIPRGARRPAEDDHRARPLPHRGRHPARPGPLRTAARLRRARARRRPGRPHRDPLGRCLPLRRPVRARAAQARAAADDGRVPRRRPPPRGLRRRPAAAGVRGPPRHGHPCRAGDRPGDPRRDAGALAAGRFRLAAAAERHPAQPDGVQGRHGQPRHLGRLPDVAPGVGEGRRTGAGLGDRRQLPRRARHPDAGRVLGPGEPARAGEHDRPPPRHRRAPHTTTTAASTRTATSIWAWSSSPSTRTSTASSPPFRSGWPANP